MVLYNHIVLCKPLLAAVSVSVHVFLYRVIIKAGGTAIGLFKSISPLFYCLILMDLNKDMLVHLRTMVGDGVQIKPIFSPYHRLISCISAGSSPRTDFFLKSISMYYGECPGLGVSSKVSAKYCGKEGSVDGSGEP